MDHQNSLQRLISTSYPLHTKYHNITHIHSQQHIYTNTPHHDIYNYSYTDLLSILYDPTPTKTTPIVHISIYVISHSLFRLVILAWPVHEDSATVFLWKNMSFFVLFAVGSNLLLVPMRFCFPHASKTRLKPP